MNGVFTISLDFELHWGGFEKWPLKAMGTNTKATAYFDQYFLNTRIVIPRMLRLFEKYGVHVTWAGVGLLMHRDRQQLEANLPALRPAYIEKSLSAYQYIEHIGIGHDEQDDPFHYAHSLVLQILNTPHQELGSHTFSHFYCNEPGQTPEQFRADLQAAQQAAAAYGVQLKSLVFPRNQFNDSYLRVCFEEGFVCVRSNPSDWFWKIAGTQHESRWKRLNRGLDAYFPVGKKNTYPVSALSARTGFPLSLPASRLLRPYRPQERLLVDLKIKRILNEMNYAARNHEVYHLWWHPHNFGYYPDESLKGLEKILTGFKVCKNEFGMTSMTMGELAETVTTFHG